jgi:hypothetical protein
MGLTISASKSEVMLFTRKDERLTILVRIESYVLPQTTCFKYLGIFFEAGLRWSCKICAAKMLPKSKLIEIGGRCFLGSASVLFDTAVWGTYWIGPGI